MLRHLLTLWLVGCTIGYSAAWAYDGHFDVLSHQQELSGTTANAEDSEDHSSCDHCCHASAHLTAICADQLDIAIPDSGNVWPRYHKLHYSILTGPPGHPPQS